MKGLYYQKILNHAKAADSELLYALGIITKNDINRGEKIVENSMTGLLSKSSMQFSVLQVNKARSFGIWLYPVRV